MTEAERLRGLAAKLRAQADELDALAARRFPDQWEVGMKVRFLKDQPWAWSKGSVAVVKGLRREYAGRRGDEYQVFYSGPEGSDISWWTTPGDVEWIQEGAT